MWSKIASFEFIHGVFQFEFMEIEFKYEVFVDDIEFEDCENCELNCIRTSLKSKSSQQSQSQWKGEQVKESRGSIKSILGHQEVLGRNPKPLGWQPHSWSLNSIRKLILGFLNTADYFGHNFGYTTRIDAIQLGLERGLKILQFICFTLFHWRTLNGP